jgi:hypothetical protein
MHRISPGFARITSQDLPATCQPVERRAACRLSAHLEMENCRCHECRRGASPCHPPFTVFTFDLITYCPHRLPSLLTILSTSLTREELKRRNTILRVVSPNSSNNGSPTLPEDSAEGVQGARARVCATSYTRAIARIRWSGSRVPRSCVSRWKAFA